jgi:putative transposase
VRKLTNKKVQWIIRRLEEGNHPEDIARFVRVSRRRIYQLKQQYKDDGHIPELKDPGRKKKPLDPECERIILDAYHTYKSRPVILEKIIKIHYDRIRKIFTKIFHFKFIQVYYL